MVLTEMPRLRFPFFLPLATALIATVGGVSGAAAEESQGTSMRQTMLRMSEFLDTTLPGVLQERNLTLHFTPKFSDLRDREYIRYPIELRYGATKHLEVSGGITPFSPNPFHRGREHRWGPGEIKLGARYDIGTFLPFFDDTTIGFESRIPLGKPPTEINDHFTHVRPFIAAARTLRRRPDVTFYANLGYDRSVELTTRGTPPAWVMRRNIIEVAPGFLYKPGQFGYFTEYRWRHIAEETEWHIAHEVQFGTIWDVPLARSATWNLPGKWQLELAYKYSQEEGHGDDHGIAARVNWRISLREWLAHTAKQTWLFR